jgi:hypothetical protein
MAFRGRRQNSYRGPQPQRAADRHRRWLANPRNQTLRGPAESSRQRPVQPGTWVTACQLTPAFIVKQVVPGKRLTIADIRGVMLKLKEVELRR